MFLRESRWAKQALHWRIAPNRNGQPDENENPMAAHLDHAKHDRNNADHLALDAGSQRKARAALHAWNIVKITDRSGMTMMQWRRLPERMT
jgi:hypothetical protein